MPDTEILAWLSTQLVRLGPGVLFVVCLLETAVFAGLILPVGALIAFSAMLASRGVFVAEEVVAVAVSGALMGDQLGFVVGRWFVSRARPPSGEIATLWGTALARTQSLVVSRGLLGISVARAIPFVRTVMPWFAGRSGVAWLRFLLFDALGVLLWGAIYVGGGFLAGKGWQQVAGRYGEEVGAVAVFLSVVVILAIGRGWFLKLMRRRKGRAR